MKLAAAALGGLVVALSLLVPAVVPQHTPPGLVDQITLQPPPAGDQRTGDRPDTVTPDRRSRATARRAVEAKASPNARSDASAGGVRPVDATLPGADSPTGQPRNDSAPRRGGSPTPRTTPVRVDSPAPEADSAPQRDPASVPSEPADPPDTDATTAGADPPDESEPADPPEADGTTAEADPPDEPEPAGVDPQIETP